MVALYHGLCITGICITGILLTALVELVTAQKEHKVRGGLFSMLRSVCWLLCWWLLFELLCWRMCWWSWSSSTEEA